MNFEIYKTPFRLLHVTHQQHPMAICNDPFGNPRPIPEANLGGALKNAILAKAKVNGKEKTAHNEIQSITNWCLISKRYRSKVKHNLLKIKAK